MPYGLKDIELAKLNEVFAANARIERVVLYGSRAKGNYKPFSDVDITLEGDELTHTDLNRLSLAIDDLLLPYQFDISIFRTLKNEALIDHIRRMGITIYEKKSEWKEYKLGEIADVQTGPFGSQLHQSDYVAAGIPSIMPVNIGNRMEISTEKIVYVTENDAERLSRYRVQEGDIVYSRRGDVEKCAYIKKEENGWLCGTGCLRIRIDLSKADSKFVAYYLSTDEMKCWISNNAVGTTMPNLNSSILQQVPISLPSIDTQRCIASIISSLDDKIDLLHRENATLEQMAETLFKQWFVVEAKEEWEEGKLGDYVELVNGVSYKGDELQPSNVAMVTLKSFDRNGGFRMDGYKEFTGKFKKEQVLYDGDLVVAHTDITQEADVIGNPVIVIGKNQYETITFSMDVVKVVSKSEFFSNSFLYYLMKTQAFKEHCLGYANGSTVLHLSKKAIPEFEFHIPPKIIAQSFQKQVESINKKILNNNNEIQTLIQTRDGLLPRLMNKEISIVI